MKGKPTWKPMGLSAKKWHEAGQAQGATNVAPSTHLPRRWRNRRKTAVQWPMQPEKTSQRAASG